MIETSLYTYLSECDEIVAIVGSQVYPHHLPQGVSFPVLTIQLVNADHDTTLVHPAGIAYHTYQIDAWSNNHSQTCLLAEAVRQSLQGFMGDMEGTQVLFTQLTDEQNLHEAPTNGSDSWIYRRMQRYRIKFRLSIPVFG